MEGRKNKGKNKKRRRRIRELSMRFLGFTDIVGKFQRQRY